MWHGVEGIQNWDSVWPKHGIWILAGPSSVWPDATGHRLPTPLFPGFDTLGTLEHILSTGYEHSWFVLAQAIIEKEFALSGSEHTPDLTGKSVRELLGGMQKLTRDISITLPQVRREIGARDRELRNPFSKDSQINAIRQVGHLLL